MSSFEITELNSGQVKVTHHTHLDVTYPHGRFRFVILQLFHFLLQLSYTQIIIIYRDAHFTSHMTLKFV